MKANSRKIIYRIISTAVCVVAALIIAKYFLGDFYWWKIIALAGFILVLYIIVMTVFRLIEKKFAKDK